MGKLVASRCRSGLRGALCGRTILWRLGRLDQEALLEPKVNEGLHGLHLLVSKQVVQLADIDKVDEASVELLVGIDVPEGVQPMAVINVGIATHHLAVDAFDIGLKVLRETRRLAQPITAGRANVCLTCGLGLDMHVKRAGGTITGWGGAGVGREDARIVDLADDPLLNQVDVLDGGDLDGLLVVVKPRIGVAARLVHAVTRVGRRQGTYPLADMVGHTSGLQRGCLVRSSMALIMSIICSSRRYCSTTGHMPQHAVRPCEMG